MAKDRHSQVSRYGPISTRSQATQTLPIQTQPPTQLMSHEVHQFTQLIHHDSAEHVRGDTLVNDSDVEESGDTIVLNDDHGELHGGVDSGPKDKGDMIRSCENGLAPPIHRNLPDSDATTEEGDVENVGYLDADADSRPPQIDAPLENEGVKTGENEDQSNLVRSSFPEVEGGHGNPTPQDTPQAALMDTNGTKYSQSKPRSISSVRAASLRASGLRAAGRSASLNSVGKDDFKLDSEATVDLMPGMLKEELTQQPLKGSEAEKCGIKDVCMTKTVELETMQSSPKVTALFDDALARSPCMSTSKSTSIGISHSHASLEQAPGLASNVPSEQGNKNFNVSEETIALEENPKSSGDHQENAAAPPEMLLKQTRSQTSIVSSKLVEHEVACSDARVGAEPGLTGQPISQKARKLVFDHMDTSPADKVVAGDRNAVSRVLNTYQSSVPSKQMTGIHPLARDQQQSMTSGNRAASANLSYAESMEPGEESQLNALNVVDKLVWLDASCMPDDVATRPVPQEDFVKSHAGTKGLKSLAQAAQMKAVHDKLDVFDWEDSQLDEDGSQENKQAPLNARGQKRQLEAHKLTVASKKQAISHQQKASSDKTGKRSNRDVSKLEMPAVEHPHGDQEAMLPDPEKMKPHALLTARLMKRTKAEPSPSSKSKHSPGLQKARRKRVSKEKQVNQSSKQQPEAGQQEAGSDIKSKEQQAAPEPRRRAGRKKAIDGSAKVVKLEPQKEKDKKECKPKRVKTYNIETKLQDNLGLADRTSQDDAAADIWIEAFSSAKSKTPVDNGADLIKFKKRSTLHEDSQQGAKKYRTVEPAAVTRGDEHWDTSEQEEVSKDDHEMEPGLKSQSNFKKSNVSNVATTSAQHGSRRVCTRRSRGHQNLENHALEEEVINRKATRKQEGKPWRASDASQGKDSTRSSQEKHQGASEREGNLLENNETERETKTEKGAKQNETANATVRSRKLSSHGSKRGHMEIHELADKGLEGTMSERGPKTRSRANIVKSQVARSDGKKTKPSGNAASKSSNTQGTANKEVGPSLSGDAVQADFDMEKPSSEAGRLRKQARLALQLPSMAARSGQDLTPAPVNAMEEVPAGHSRRSNRGRETADGFAPESAKAREEAPAGGAKRSKRGLEAADASVLELGEIREDTVSQPLMHQKDEFLFSSRRTRSGSSKGGLQRNEAVDDVKVSQGQGDATSEDQTLKNQAVNLGPLSSKSLSKESKSAKALRALEKLSGSSVVDEGRRKKREPGEIRVLFSHSLTDDTIKHQKKILAKLGGQLATTALECTHFISNGFVRSQNMLISMASGKIVATTLWLESCGQAHYFVDEKNYILHDERKEKELGFSMITSLSAARRKPLFKDVRVLICPNTTPEPAALEAIIKCSGGQVMEERSCLSESDKESDKPLIVIANEKGLDSCYQLLVKGLKVHSEELVLQGVVTQTLDFSRNRLFEDCKQHRGSRRVANSHTGA